PRHAAAASSVTALLAVYRDAWFPALPELVRSRRHGEERDVTAAALIGWPVERGFATRVNVASPFDGWLDYAGRIVAAEPIGEFVAHGTYGAGGETVSDLVPALDTWPRADRFRTLALRGELPADAAAGLGRCRHLANLRKLHVEFRSARAVAALADG